jgi:soluble lytic murein transglycosylase-like protein
VLLRSRRVINVVNHAAFLVGTAGVLAAAALTVGDGNASLLAGARRPGSVTPLVSSHAVVASLDPAVEQLIADTFGAVADEALAIAKCESSMNPKAISPGQGSWGLFQINRYAHADRVSSMGYSWAQLLDPAVNVVVAKSVYDDAGGWGPWECAWAVR